MSRVVLPAFSRRHSSKPPTSGMTTSLRIRSGISRSNRVERFRTIGGLPDGIAVPREQLADELAHVLHVVDDEHAAAGARADDADAGRRVGPWRSSV